LLRVRKSETSPLPTTRSPRPLVRLRKDLKITNRPGEGNAAGSSYLIEDPATGENFSFGEEEYFLCQAMDGLSTSEEILTRFSLRFGLEMTKENFRSFEEHLLAMGLAENISPPARSASSQPAGTEESARKGSVRRTKSDDQRWALFNPERAFEVLLHIVQPVQFVFKLLVFALIPGVPIAIYLIIRHSEDYQWTLRLLASELGYFGHLIFTLFAANLLRCVIQGVLCAYYKAPVQEFGIRLRFGIIPRFYIERKEAHLRRSAKLWIYGSSLLLRLFLITAGALVWFLYQGSGHVLGAFGVLLAQAGVIGLIIISLPVRNSDGFRWLVTYFGLPPNMLRTVFDVFLRVIRRKPLPASLSPSQVRKYFLWALAIVVCWGVFAVKVTLSIAAGLEKTFPGIFGRATPFILAGTVAALFLRGIAAKYMRNRNTTANEQPGPMIEDDIQEADTVWDILRRHRTLVIAGLLGLALFIPCAYRPGGEIQVLPPIQQQIQAPVAGKVAEVKFEGGDGKLIASGTVVAKMISSEIENQILTLEQSKAQQVSTIDKLKSELSKLLAGAREEEIVAAYANFQQADEQVKIARQELEAAKVSAAYSTMVLPRMGQLYESGSIAFLQYEEAKKTADLDKINVEKQQKNLASLEKNREESQAQLDLLRSGARPEDIDAARHAVQAAQAELSRIEQQIQFAHQQQTESALLMPFDGYLRDSHLDFRKGSYLQLGEAYATAQDNTEPLVEVQLPEYDMEGVEVGADTTVKLFAYPNIPLQGKVLSIQPAALPSSAEQQTVIAVRMFQVLIEIEKAPFVLKAGMTGYAKISAGFQPLGYLLARPMLRFVQIEVWSWLP
jgi:putative peptide zinc metalloprotease protein